MELHNLAQGSPEWHAHRLTHFNASDAPAMMGCSPYKTRSQLLYEMHTGIVPDVDAATQRRFDDGHRFEALARPLAEEIIGDDLYPVVGSLSVVGLNRKLSASFDGLTMDRKIDFEHKKLNNALRDMMHADVRGHELGLHYQVQMEQQLLVSASEKTLFMASDWVGESLDEEHHCWYLPNLELRQQIIDGWIQFEKDLADYVPAEIKEKPKTEAIASLPALFIHAKGEITTNNMPEYGVALAAHLKSARAIVLITDQDFSNAKEQAKVFREQREKLQAVKESMLSQTTTIGEAARMIDDWSEDLRLTALKIEKDVEKEDIAKKLAMVNAAKVKYTDHITALEVEIAPVHLAVVAPDFAAAIKGKRNYSSMQDAIDVALANSKIAADASGKAIRANLAHYKADATGYEFLFADLAQLAHKAADDFALVVKARIEAHKAAEAKRLEDERTRIAEEERVKAEASAKVRADAEIAAAAEVQAEANRQAEASRQAEAATAAAIESAKKPEPTVAHVPFEAVVALMPETVREAMNPDARAPGYVPHYATPPTLKLGVICTRLGFQVTAEFLRGLGFEPAGRERAAVLYHEADFQAIGRALIEHIESVLEAVAA